MIRNNITITTKDIVLIGTMLTTLEVAKYLLSFISGIEVISLLFIVYTLFFEKKMVYLLSAFYIVEGALYGFGIWWFMYLYIWALLVFITYLFRKNNSVWFWSTLSGLYGLLFGLLCSPVYLVIGGVQMAASWWITGISTDIIHGISNFILCDSILEAV